MLALLVSYCVPRSLSLSLSLSPLRPRGTPNARPRARTRAGTFITVDLYDNYGSALPLFILSVTILQIGFFLR